MSEPFQVNLSRATPSQPWGFRLQGGSDFSTPLSVQSVNPNSIAEHCGLKAGDAVLQIGNRSSHELQHEQAKQEIGASGDNVIMLVQRGAIKVWQPKVTPLADIKPGQMHSVPTQPGGDPEPYVQRTSLAADKSEPMKINFFNKSARPFPGAGGSAAPSQPAPSVPVIMNAQYNTPMGMYSTQNALEAFDCQSQGMVDDMDRNYGQQSAPQGAPVGGQNNTPSGMRSVKAPTGPPPNVQIQQAQHMTCKCCGSLIVGVFVRIKGEPMHPECFKCVRCGKNLKNQGHFTVEGQMHCEQCAQIVSAPPDQNMVATAVYR